MGLNLCILVWDNFQHSDTFLEQAANVNALGSLNREDVKKICGENVPQWISFPEYEQVKCYLTCAIIMKL